MKKLYTLLFIFIIIRTVYGQSNNFAPVGASWWYSDIYDIDYDDTLYIEGYNLVESIGDTTIEGMDCRILRFSYVDPDGITLPFINYRYIYEDNEKVYCRSEDKFKLIYDFSGANWYAKDIVYETGDSSLVIVDSVKFELYETSTLKTLYVHHDLEESFFYNTTKIVEKIGPFGYLFLYNGGDDSFPPSGLRCYFDSDVNYKVNESYPCDSLTPEITAIGNVKNSQYEITFPNNDLINISGITEPTNIYLINLLGQKMYNETETVNAQINIQNIAKGNYILLLKTQNTIYTQKICVL